MVDDNALEEILDKARKDVKTESYPMSIGELIGMYEKDEIILRPEYQRYFRWTHEQKSKLIESVLIGLPLPSFFMAQDEKGNWEVVDGMQRLSTILDFIGVLKEENKVQGYYERFEKLADDLFYLDGYADKGWDDFSRRIQLDVRRTKVQLTILLRETNLDAKFELFQRLNSGGTSISGQELRNAIMAGESPEMLEWFEGLAGNTHFVEVIGLTEKDKSTRYDMELVLRFMVFQSEYGSKLKEYKSVDVFLTHVLREFIKDKKFDYKGKKSLFEKTFSKIFSAWGKDALRFKTSPGSGKFSISFFEAVAFGIAQNIDKLPSDNVLKKKINSIGNEVDYKLAAGTGKNANYRIPKLLALGKKHFKNG
jgi:Protein of unknown function DUF262